MSYEQQQDMGALEGTNMVAGLVRFISNCEVRCNSSYVKE